MSTGMRYGISFFCLLMGALIISSCQREITDDIPGSSNNNSCSGNLLAKLISTSQIDSTVTEFEYDANRRLIKEISKRFNSTNPGSTDILITRDANGIITRIKNVGHYMQGSDSTDSHFFYNTSDRRYTHVVAEITFSGYITTDSILFNYDASGKLAKQDVYVHYFTPGPYYTLDAKYEYSYDNNGNVSKFIVYSRDQSTNVMGLEVTYEYTYDKKKRALQLDAWDALALNLTITSSFQNVTSIKVTDVKFPIYDGTYTEQFTYNSCDRPVTMMETFSASNNYRKLQYFYK